ncbi:MAG: glycoside hydrolase domain-containing protein [Bacillota bacterium]
MSPRLWAIVCAVLLGLSAEANAAEQAKNLLADPSFELTKQPDQFGLVFVKWSGWKYEGDCEFRVGQVAHSGKSSCLLYGGGPCKIRVRQEVELEAGRYRITAYLRGLDIGKGTWNANTEFMFDDKYMPLAKGGTFGWTKLTYVGEIKNKKKALLSFGLMAPGRFWIDDVTLERVGEDVALTEKPVLGKEEGPIEPAGALGADAIRCAECGYRNASSQKVCYACGATLEARKAIAGGPSVKGIASFENGNPFDGGSVVAEHATDGGKALRIDQGYASMGKGQDWTGYDYLKADLYTDAQEPMHLYVEVRDAGTRDYWTRVNYETVVPPGASTLIIPVKQLYVGEKSRPGRMLDLGHITQMVLSIGEKPIAPLFIDNVRLERDETPQKVQFEGLWAFDFGTSSSPVMEGFTPITPGTLYSKGRGYGLKDAQIWRAFDALQPEPLYQDFICIESGGLAVDVPNGRYRVFVNIDNPSGFWGEYQAYRKRAILAEGKPVVTDTMDYASFRNKYFRFWNVEDLPTENTFDKYQKAYFKEKVFEIEVTDGQLNIDFSGSNWACSVSAVILFPIAKQAEGEQFLKYAQEKRRFYFDNYFKRILHRATGDAPAPTEVDQQRGYMTFGRDYMKTVYYNDTPMKEEVGKPLTGEAFAGEYEPIALGLVPLKDLGRVTVKASDLSGPAGTIPASAIEVGYVSYRLSRVSMDGAVYTIAPRLIMPLDSVDMPKEITRRFWLTVKVPADAKPGLYKGSVAIEAEKGAAAIVPVEFRVRAGMLDPVDVPAGPWGCEIPVPWPGDEARGPRQELVIKSLHKMREYGFTTCSGFPTIRYKGFQKGQPVLDFTQADAEMKLAKELGFLAVVAYGSGVSGIDGYHQDTAQMEAAGFKDYSEFIKAVYNAVRKHADQAGWIPVYYNLCDEPQGDDAIAAAENAEAYRKAFPKGPPYFTGATSFTGSNANDPHFRLAKAFHVADWNLHDEPGVNLIHQAGSDWAFYNGGNRWTFGQYLYKAAKQFGMKFRLSWHWNACAGDPYYALDCREDDYAWCNCTPDGRLVPSVEFEQLREGLDDYRRLITLTRLAKEKAGTPEATAAQKLLENRMRAFKLGQREAAAIIGPDGWNTFRQQVDEAIEALR